MDGQVNGVVIRERAHILREMAAEKTLRFRRQQLGRVLDVVTLGEPSRDVEATSGCATISGCTRGLTHIFLEVYIPGELLRANLWIRVIITSVA